MATKIDFYRFPYDDEVAPAFITLPAPPHPLNEEGDAKFVYHRGTGRIFDMAGLTAAMEAAEYTPDDNEFGEDDAWLVENTDYLGEVEPDGPVVSTVAGITFTVSGAGTNTLIFDVAGTPTADATVECRTVSVDGNEVLPIPTFDIEMGQMSTMVAATLYSALIAGETSDGVKLSGTVIPTPEGATGTVTNDGTPGIFDSNFSVVEV